MDCSRINELLVDYLYQELDPAEVERFEAHLQSCPRCSEELTAFESTRSMMQQLPEEDPPPRISAFLLAEAAQAVQPPPPGFWERLHLSLRMMVMHPAMTAAVTLVLVLGVSFFVYRRGPGLSESKVDLPLVQDERVLPADKTATITLGEREGVKETAGLPAAADGVTAEPAPAGKHQLVARKQPAAEPSADLEDSLRGAGGAAAPVASGRARRAVATGKSLGLLAKKKAPRRPASNVVGNLDAVDDLDSAGVGGKQDQQWGQGEAKAGNKDQKFATAGDRGQQAEQRRPAAKPAASPAAPTSSAPRVARATAQQGPSPVDTLLQRAEDASEAGRCLDAFSYYHKVLGLQPSLKGRIAHSVQQCAAKLGKDGEAPLVKAKKSYYRLATLLEPELERSRRARIARQSQQTQQKKARSRAGKQAPTKAPAKAKSSVSY